MICADPNALLIFVTQAFSEKKAESKFLCRGGDSGYAAAEAVTQNIQAQCPELPWGAIEKVADDLFYSDRAIELGTTCQDYIYSVRKRMVTEATVNSVGECSGRIDMAACLKNILCMKVGGNSTECP